MTASDVVRAFWAAMETNDFHAASLHLAETYRCIWPQSGEVIEGRRNFAKINTRYPASGRWRFDVLSLIEEDTRVVTEVAITDGTLMARAITFHTVHGGAIVEQVEYWPDPYDPPRWRSDWVRVKPAMRMDIRS